jgi:hypothetical protein
VVLDDEFLHRRDGFYWRAGGTFEVDPVEEDQRRASESPSTSTLTVPPSA